MPLLICPYYRYCREDFIQCGRTKKDVIKTIYPNKELMKMWRKTYCESFDYTKCKWISKIEGAK